MNAGWGNAIAGRTRRLLPRGPRDALLQLGLWLVADLMYEGVRGIVAGQTVTAFANARTIVSIEQSLGVFWEAHIQSLMIGHHALTLIVNWFYLNAQFTVNLAFLAFVYLRRNDIFYFVRNVFFVSMAVALIVHLLVPVAPPRMLPEYGFFDTVQHVSNVNQDGGAIGLFVNPFAAVPSMHTCFALIVGVCGLRMTRRWWLRGLCLLYPLAVVAAILLTANHFIFDAFTGAGDAILAAVVAQRVMARVRPESWAWGRRTGRALAGTAEA